MRRGRPPVDETGPSVRRSMIWRPMTVHVQLFGGFSVTVEGRPTAVDGKTERRILARLCLAPAGGVTRRFLAAEIWPECEFTVSGNRLRTGLVGLRKALGIPHLIHSDRRSVWLDPERVSSDVQKAQESDRAAQRALDDEEASLAWSVLAESSSAELLPGWEEDWADAARVRWSARHVEACLQRCLVAVRQDDLTTASDWSGRALDADPRCTQAWALWFQTMAAQGLGPEASRRFFDVRDRLGLKGPTWADIDAAAKAARVARSRPESSRSLSLLEADFVQRAFARLMADDPSAAARFLATRPSERKSNASRHVPRT